MVLRRSNDEATDHHDGSDERVFGDNPRISEHAPLGAQPEGAPTLYSSEANAIVDA